jgi:lysophospholipase L1-like esterase
MKPRFHVCCVVAGALLLALPATAQPSSDEFDRGRARALHEKVQRSEQLTAEEQAYYERARKLRGQLPGRDRARSNTPQKAAPAAAPQIAFVATPLTELGDGTYKGQDGGLYGKGRNEPPKDLADAARTEAASVRPLDPDGKPAKDGKIVFISIGMSNTTQEFSEFVTLAKADSAVSPHVVVIDGAQGGQEASDWAHPSGRARKERGEKRNPWDVLDARLKMAGVTTQQVQVVWMKQARRNPASLGEFPRHARELQTNQEEILRMLKARFPNLRLAYLSSRIYAGYASTPLNPEPYAYESAFANRWSIERQLGGSADLNWNPSNGAVKAPLILWGPYLWASGTTPRKADGLDWKPQDYARDGTHPSTPGAQAVAAHLLQFFKTDPTTKGWFVKDAR